MSMRGRGTLEVRQSANPFYVTTKSRQEAALKVRGLVRSVAGGAPASPMVRCGWHAESHSSCRSLRPAAPPPPSPARFRGLQIRSTVMAEVDNPTVRRRKPTEGPEAEPLAFMYSTSGEAYGFRVPPSGSKMSAAMDHQPLRAVDASTWCCRCCSCCCWARRDS